MKKTFILIFFVLCASFLCAQAQWALDTVISLGANTSGIDITPDGSKIVVSCKTNTGTVNIINTSNYSITSVAVSSYENNPDAIRCIPGNNIAIAATLHKLIYIDINAGTVLGAFVAPCAGTTLYGLDVSSNGSTLYFPDLSGGCTLQGLRQTTGNTVGTSSTFTQVSTGGVLTAVALNNAGSAAMLTAYNGNPRIVNLGTGAVTNVTGLSGSYGIAAMHTSSEFLLFDGDSVVRISSSGSVIKKIAALSYNTSFQNIAITSDDKYAFVIGAFEKLVISLTDNTVLQTFTAGGTNVACKADGSKFYVTDYYNGTVRVYKKSNSSNIPFNKSNNNEVRVYPNPGAGQLIVELESFSEKQKVLRLLDLDGKFVKDFPLQENKNVLKLDGVAKGMYVYELDADGTIHKGRLVIE